MVLFWRMLLKWRLIVINYSLLPILQVFADANGASSGNQALGINSAALVQVTSGAIAGTYVIINDSTAGFQSLILPAA